LASLWLYINKYRQNNHKILTFNLPNKSYYTGACKGNGLVLGMSNGTVNGAFTQIKYGNMNRSVAKVKIGAENVSLGTDAGDITDSDYYGWGITTDETKSGIIVEPDTNIKLVIKY